MRSSLIKEVEVLLPASGWWLWSILVLDRLDRYRVLAGQGRITEGHGLLIFIFSLIFFPAALIVAYIVSDRTTARA